MSAIPSITSAGGEQASNFSVLYVVLGGVALITAVALPITVMVTLRYSRRRSQFREQQLLGVPGVITEENLQQEEPKLFDVYVKPGLEVREPRLDYILVSRGVPLVQVNRGLMYI
jgi:hypothetical protein